MIGRLLISIVLLGLPASAYSQGPMGGTVELGPYENIVLKLRSGETKVNFRDLRFAYADSKDALASGSSHLTRRAMNTALLNRRYNEVVRIAGDILKAVFISPDTHAALSVAFRELGENQKADFHKRSTWAW